MEECLYQVCGSFNTTLGVIRGKSMTIPSFVGEGDVVGDFVKSKKNLIRPFHKNVINDGESFEKIMNYLYQQHFAKKENCFVIYPLHTSRSSLKTMCELFFELHNGERICAVNEFAVRSKGDGIYVNIGSNTTSAVCISDNYLIENDYINLGGDHIDSYLQETLKEKGKSIDDFSVFDYRTIKENCSVSNNFMRDLQLHETNLKPKSITTSQNTVIEITLEQILAPELLFIPSLNNLTERSIVQLINDLVKRLPFDLRDSTRNVYISGGTSLFCGLDQRLNSELNLLWPDRFNVILNEVPTSQRCDESNFLLSPNINCFIEKSNFSVHALPCYT